jgi:hypothetical protein
MDGSPINLVNKVVVNNALVTLSWSVDDLSKPTVRIIYVFRQLGGVTIFLVSALPHGKVHLLIHALRASVFVSPKEDKMAMTLLISILRCISLYIVQYRIGLL